MKLSELMRSVLFVAAAVAHFVVQWLGWKIHLHEVVPAAGSLVPAGDTLWNLCSFPLFTLLPRRIQHLHFFEMLIANSLVWGAAAVYVASIALRSWSRRRRLVRRDMAAQLHGARASIPDFPAREQYWRGRDASLVDTSVPILESPEWPEPLRDSQHEARNLENAPTAPERDGAVIRRTLPRSAAPIPGFEPTRHEPAEPEAPVRRTLSARGRR